jgi:hypothetical protein
MKKWEFVIPDKFVGIMTQERHFTELIMQEIFLRL